VLNRFFAGTLLPRLQMDLLPGYFCAAHFVIVAQRPLQNVGDHIAGGRALQRFWLTATSLGLQFQPEMTPLIFSRYSIHGREFTENSRATSRAGEVAEDLKRIVGDQWHAD